MKNSKSGAILFLLILSAIIVGGFLGEFFKNNSFLNFLAWGFPVGTMEPLNVDLKMLKFSLGLVLNINFASIVALGLALYFYKKL